MILFWRKKPWVDLQHEEEFIPKNYSERGVDTGAKLEEQLVGNVDLIPSKGIIPGSSSTRWG